VVLEDAVTIGSGAVVIQGVRVGAGTTVGAGAVVVRDLPAGVTVVGVPARVVRSVAA
jgi:maltose O-acetyltransferase